jgi:hypothetical protein
MRLNHLIIEFKSIITKRLFKLLLLIHKIKQNGS